MRYLPPQGKNKKKQEKKYHQVESDNEPLNDDAIAGQGPATQIAQGTVSGQTAATDGDSSTTEEGNGASEPHGGPDGYKEKEI